MPFVETPLDNGNGKALPIGLVSLGFGALYLAAVHLCDRRRLHALGTAFVIPAVLALVTARRGDRRSGPAPRSGAGW